MASTLLGSSENQVEELNLIRLTFENLVGDLDDCNNYGNSSNFFVRVVGALEHIAESLQRIADNHC